MVNGIPIDVDDTSNDDGGFTWGPQDDDGLDEATNDDAQTQTFDPDNAFGAEPIELGGNLFNPELSAGPAEQTWEDFNLELAPVHLDGEDTGRRLILRDGKFIADVTDRYKLLPNERMVAVADHVAEELGAVPWDDFGGDWFIRMDEHVIQDEEGRRAHALYAWDEPVTLPDGDTIQLGFAIHNSIDASLGFNVGLFTFRHACANMVWIGVNGEGMDFDDREVISHYSHKHTKELKVSADDLRELIEYTVALAPDIPDAYRQWQEDVITPEQTLEFIDRFPYRDLPEWMQNVADTIERAEENESIDEEDIDREGIAQTLMPDGVSAFDTYNDFTETIWHAEATNDRSKHVKMKALHKVMPPADWAE